jgi:hypothetical protein
MGKQSCVGLMGQNGMDDMRGESANDDREQMIDTIMECEGVTRAEAEQLYHEGE